jgi:leucyl/phenylalanyl-tRNA--protein transferase
MVRAYAAGIFPMSESAEVSDVFWVDPQERGVFPLDGFHLSRSLRRQIKRAEYRVHVNRDFAGVVEGCAAREQTWINGELFGCYLALNAQGLAHSVEIWDGEGLAGAVFGLTLGAAFFGESMFSARTGGSKLALAHLVHRLRFGGFTLFDTQFVTDHLISLGAVEIPRAAYREQLAKALQKNADFLALPEGAPLVALS